MFQQYKKEIRKLESGESRYTWDELEEVISEGYEDERLTSEEYDILMKQLMNMDEGLME